MQLAGGLPALLERLPARFGADCDYSIVVAEGGAPADLKAALQALRASVSVVQQRTSWLTPHSWLTPAIPVEKATATVS